MSLREPTLFTLAALRDGPLHGYAIAARAKELSGGRVSLTAGTLYGALDRLVGSGLVEVDREEVVEGRKRRYHRLTEAGGHAVEEELGRLRSTLTALDDAAAGGAVDGGGVSGTKAGPGATPPRPGRLGGLTALRRSAGALA